MMTDSGVTKIRLRGSNPALANMLPGLYSLAGHCTTLGSFLDEAFRYLASVRLEVMTLEYHAGTRELTLMVRG
jgi:hypothetical protein